MTHARKFVVTGRVQGVGFRYFVEREAQALALAGYVRNLDDGSVEVHAQGSREALDALEGLLWKGPRFADVRAVQTSGASMLKYESFRIR